MQGFSPGSFSIILDYHPRVVIPERASARLQNLSIRFKAARLQPRRKHTRNDEAFRFA
jgi:hypothetical protein